MERRHYVFAIVATCAALAVTFVATHWLEDFPLLILLTAVMASALRGGTGPGLVATALSAFGIQGATHLLADTFRIPPVNLGDEVVRLVIFLAVATGISLLAGARRQAERERDALLVREKSAREQAEAASMAKDRLLATVSHELRNPLAAILSWASLLRGGQVEESRLRRALEAIERNAKTQARLIEDLLDLSRIASGKMRIDPRPTDLASAIEAAIETVRPAAAARHVAFTVALDRGVGLINGDTDRLQQVVWNLLSNAVKFTPEGGYVSLALRRVDSQAELRVTDTGQGVPPELLPHLFEPFWQAEVGSGRRTAGLGLGLAIVRHLVELHGGSVAAHSDGVGRGTTFRITIPVTSAEDDAIRAADRVT